jgi:hypothetical protein
MGKPLDTRGGQSPLGRLGFLIGMRSTQTYWGGRCGKERPAEGGDGGCVAAADRGETSAPIRGFH